ncbi:MAG: hypothetical protein EOO14_11175 [Chitinophagaceae bacterium]|nr:MAG: hypothetical protein EOO14_11175 [Chitinophagaceae bacterium]
MNNNNDNRKEARQEEEIKIYGAPGSTLQTPEEHQHDQSIDPRKDNTMEVANDDLRKTDVERMQEDLDGKRGDIEEIDDTLSNDR